MDAWHAVWQAGHPPANLHCLSHALLPCRTIATVNERVSYIGCHVDLLKTAQGNLNGTLMPDAILPSPAGYERMFAGCAPAFGGLHVSQDRIWRQHVVCMYMSMYISST